MIFVILLNKEHSHCTAVKVMMFINGKESTLGSFETTPGTKRTVEA